MAPLVWLVTGSTSGIGAALVQGIAGRGDKVIATGRGAEQRLAHLKSDNIAVLDLDVTASKSDIDEQISKAVTLHGRIDVLVNNAGMSSTSPLEEASEAFVAQIFGVNLFGSMKVTQAVLPYMRAQGAGRIAFIGAGLAWGPFPFLGHYAMAKAALSSKPRILRTHSQDTDATSFRRDPRKGGLSLWHPRYHLRVWWLQHRSRIETPRR